MKKPMDPYAVYGRQQTFVFGECETCYVSMSSCVVVNGGQLNGAEARGPVVVQLFKVPHEDGTEDGRTCVKLIGKRETVFLLIGAWHEGSPVLKTVVLPVAEGGTDIKEGTGGYVFWNGREPARDTVSRFARRQTSKEDKALWVVLSAGGRACGKLPSELAGKPRRPAATPAPQSAASPAGGAPSESDWALMAAEGFGSGYLVGGRFWVTKDFSRVITRPEKADEKLNIWMVPFFTGLLLKVLIDNRKPRGLTSVELYDAAKKLYTTEAEKARSTGRILQDDPPFPKALGQFFRVMEGGERVEHPIYDVIDKFGHRPVTYFLSGKWGAPDDGG